MENCNLYENVVNSLIQTWKLYDNKRFKNTHTQFKFNFIYLLIKLIKKKEFIT